MKARLNAKFLLWKWVFYWYANKTNFHIKSFALSFAFIMRFTATRKWPIGKGAGKKPWERGCAGLQVIFHLSLLVPLIKYYRLNSFWVGFFKLDFELVLPENKPGCCSNESLVNKEHTLSQCKYRIKWDSIFLNIVQPVWNKLLPFKAVCNLMQQDWSSVC